MKRTPMKRVLAIALVTGTTLMASVARVHAGASTDAALALGAFAVFNELVRGETVLNGFAFGEPGVPRMPVAPVVVQLPPPAPVVCVAPPARVHVAPPPRVYVALPVYVAPPPVVRRGAIYPGHGKVKYVKRRLPAPRHGSHEHGGR